MGEYGKLRYQFISRVVFVVVLGVVILFGPDCASAAPSISNVLGTIINDSTVTISGSGFGTNGPNVVLYDNFESGTNGDDITLNSSTIGGFSGYQNIHGKYSTTYALGGSKSMLANGNLMDDVTLDNAGVYFYDASGFDEMYVSFNFLAPTGQCSPGNNMKLAWWCETTACSNEPNLDIVLLTSTCTWSNGWWTLSHNAGSDIGAAYIDPVPNDIVELNEWSKIGFYVKTSHTANAGDNIYEIYNLSRHSNRLVKSLDASPHVANHAAPNTFHYLFLIGYGRSCPEGSSCQWYFDDVYIAIGPAARARVELSNSSTYTSSTEMAILTPTSWTDGHIDATVRQGSFDNGQQAYLYVVDSAGAVNVNGYPVTIAGGTQTDLTPPASPSGLTVQ